MALPVSALANADDSWDGRFGSAGRGTTGEVAAFATLGPDLYVGGVFRVAGGVLVNGIGRWDGSAWSALGSGVNGEVRTILAVGSDLYVGGSFTTAGGVPASRVAKWDGANWTSLGSGTDGEVRSLAAIDGEVYAAGNFQTAGGQTAHHVAKWDGSQWSPLGNGNDAKVWALQPMGGDLYAVGEGYFRDGDGAAVGQVARWDGTAWSAVGSGPPLDLYYALTVLGADLWVGGNSTLFRWDGSTWTEKGSGTVAALSTSGTDLYLGGQSIDADNGQQCEVAKWDGTMMSCIRGDNPDQNFVSYVDALVVVGSDLYAGGQYRSAAGTDSQYLSKWDGTRWSAVGARSGGQGLNGVVHSFAVAGTDLYAGGNFTVSGGAPADYIARWDGTSWSSVGAGLAHDVDALAVIESDVYAASGGVVSRWNGAAWVVVGVPAPAANSSPLYEPDWVADGVHSLAVMGTNLYAAGRFDTVDGAGAYNIAKWDGIAWTTLGAWGGSSGVSALAVIGSDLYAASGESIGRWDGSSWTDVSAGWSLGRIFSLASIGPDLYAGGASGVARWNGSVWSPLGAGSNGWVRSLVGIGGNLYATGRFSVMDGVQADGVAEWNGAAWSALGSGLGDGVSVLWAGGGSNVPRGGRVLADLGGNLFVGGNFTSAGGKDSAFVALWYTGDGTCGNGALDAGEDCDPTVAATGTCCSSSTCQFGAAGAECRSLEFLSSCDVAETCDGSSANCPADAMKTAGTTCRETAGVCDLAETCDGSTPFCVDVLLPASTECRPAAGVCDAAEFCTGSGPSCPTNAFLYDDVVCRPAAGECDAAEVCDGGSADCEPDQSRGGGSCSDDGDPCTPDVCNSEDNICEHLDFDTDGVGNLCDDCTWAVNPDQLNSDCADPSFPWQECDISNLEMFGCGDGGDLCDPCPAQKDNNNCSSAASASALIGAAGGVLETGDGSTVVDIPPGALSGDVSISVTNNGPAESFAFRGGLVASVSARPSGERFDVPVSVSMRWKDRDGDNLVDLGSCDGGGDAGLSCDSNSDCDAGKCSATVVQPESGLVMTRNSERFGYDGFAGTVFECADHASGACASATADCGDASGTGHSTVAGCCDSSTNTWTFRTCSFSEYAIGDPAAAMIPGRGKPDSDCTAEWVVDNPLNSPAMDSKGFPNVVQTCRDGDVACDGDGAANGACTFRVAVCLNVPDRRLIDKKTGAGVCSTTSIDRWEGAKPRPDSKKPVEAQNAAALRDAVRSLAGGTISGDHQQVVSFSPSLAATTACTSMAPVVVPLARETSTGKTTLKIRTTSSGGAVDSDVLKLWCVPSQ